MQQWDALNGELVTHQQVPRSQIYGDGLFETIAVKNQNLLWFSKHFQRLMRGVRVLQYELPQDFSETTLKNQIQDLLQLNRVQNGKVRILITRKGNGLFLPNHHSIDLRIQTFPLKEVYTWRSEGIKVGIYQSILLYPTPLKQFKSCNALPYVLAAIEAASMRLEDNLLLSYQHQLAELTSSNLFFVMNHQLFTPDLKTGCLQGTMRETILELAESLSIPTHKASLSLEEVHSVSEMFATNAIQGIVPIRSIQGISKTFSTSHNEITRLLYHELLKNVT